MQGGGRYFWPIPYPWGGWVSQVENHQNPKSTQGTFGHMYNMIFSDFWLNYCLLGQFRTLKSSQSSRFCKYLLCFSLSLQFFFMRVKIHDFLEIQPHQFSPCALCLLNNIETNKHALTCFNIIMIVFQDLNDRK